MSQTKDRELLLSADRVRELLDYDPETGVFVWSNAYLGTRRACCVGRVAGRIGGNGYVVIGVDGRIWCAHRLAWLYMYEKWPTDLLDHINLCKTDNRISNLRECTHSTNKANREAQANSKSGVKGIFWSKPHQKYRASLKSKHLGLFEDIEAAKAAYNAAARAKYGDFARLV